MTCIYKEGPALDENSAGQKEGYFGSKTWYEK